MLKEQSRVKELEHEEELEVLRNQANQGQSLSQSVSHSVTVLDSISHSCSDTVPQTQ